MTPHRKEVAKRIRSITGRHNLWTVWSDFVEMSAISLSNAVNPIDAREERYLAIARRYEAAELQRFAEALGAVALAFEDGGHDDVLGGVFMELELWFPTLERDERVELGRFVLLDEVPGNGETWFLARCFEVLRARGVAGVISFSDPVPRYALDGRLVMPGHVGTAYQASNALYLGRGAADTVYLLPDGRSYARRSYQKIRGGERGWRPYAAILERLGADHLPGQADEPTRRAWLDTWMPRLTRPMIHPGNHRFGWTLDRRRRRHAPRPVAPYPKEIDRAP